MEYSENQSFKISALNMLSEIENFCEANEKFNVCIDTLAQAVINPLKISYIKKEKIVKLLEHAGIEITDKPTPEQREKYFNCCSLQKFANNFFNKDSLNVEQLAQFNTIVKNAVSAVNSTLKKDFHLLDGKRIPEIYTLENNKSESTITIKGKDYSASIDGSCMQGKSKDYFDIYKDIDTNRNDVKIAILTQGTEIISRAIVWIKKPAGEIDRRKKQEPETFFIDRIYTKTQEHRTETQAELYMNVLKYYNCVEVKELDKDNPENIHGYLKRISIPTFYNKHNIIDTLRVKLAPKYGTCLNIISGNYCGFDVYTNECAYDRFPYMDSLQWFDTCEGRLTPEREKGSYVFTLDSTCGDYSTSAHECEECGYDVEDEDDLHFVETAEQSCCDDCATFCDERDEYIMSDDAVYNNYTGCYHYRQDLEY